MRIIKVNYPRDHELVLAGDLHCGSILSDGRGFSKCVEYVLAEPDRRFVSMGDLFEGRTLDHPYFDLADHKLLPLQVRDHLVDILSPVRDRIDVMLMGNHEWDLRKFGNVTNELCKQLSTPRHKIMYGTMSCVLEVYEEDDSKDFNPELLMYKAYLHHGFSTIRSQAKDFEQQEGNMNARLKLLLRGLAGDCLVMAMGHTHGLRVVEPTGALYLYHRDFEVKQDYVAQGWNERYIDPDRRWYANTGAFLLRSTEQLGQDGLHFSGYPERRGYKPMIRGFVVIKAENGRLRRVEEIRL